MRIRFAGQLCFLLTAALLVTGCKSSSSARVPEGASPGEILALALAERDAGNLEAARDLFERIEDEHPSSPEARAAEWGAAEATYGLGEMKKARKAYQAYHATHPLDHLGELENRMYDIGVRLYEGGRSGLFGLGILPTTEEGIITLTWVTENLPNGSRSDDAFFYLGSARLEDDLYEEAVLFFEELLARHPESEWRYEALFLKGSAHLLMNRGPAYDLDSLVAARRDFRTYIREVERNPARAAEYAERIEAANAGIEEVNRRIAEKNLLIARFYLTLERPESADFYLRAAAEQYGETEAGQEALRILSEIEGGRW